MKFALTVTLFAAVLASAIAAPKPDFFSDMAANAQKFQAAIKDWTQQWANNVQQKQAEFTEAQNKFGNIGERLNAFLQPKIQEITVKVQDLAKQALSVVEKTKEKIQAGFNAKRADVLAFAKTSLAKANDMLAEAQKLETQFTSQFEDTIQKLATESKKWAETVGNGLTNGGDALQTLVTDLASKVEQVKAESIEKVEEAKKYALAVKEEVEKAATQKFGSSNYNDIIDKLAGSVTQGVQQYKDIMDQVTSQGSEKAQELAKLFVEKDGQFMENIKTAWEQVFKAQVGA